MIEIGCGCKKNESHASEIPQSRTSTFQKITFTNPENSREEITLISENECEVTSGPEILLGNYSRDASELRIVVNELGTSVVEYFTIQPDSLKSRKDGHLLLTEAGLKKLEEQKLRDLQAAEERKKQIAVSGAQLILGRWQETRDLLGYNEGVFSVDYFSDGTWISKGSNEWERSAGTWKIVGNQLSTEDYYLKGYLERSWTIRDLTRDTYTIEESGSIRKANRSGDMQTLRELNENEKLLLGKWKDENSTSIYSISGTRLIKFDGDGTVIGTWRTEGDIILENYQNNSQEYKTRIQQLSESKYILKDSNGNLWHASKIR